MPSKELTSQEEISHLTFKRSWTSAVTHSQPMPKLKLLRISRKKCVMLLTIMMLPCKRLKRVTLAKRIMSSQMVERSSSATRDSEPPRSCSSLNWTIIVTIANSKVFNNMLTTPSKNVMLMLEETFIKILSSVVVQPYSTVWVRECGKNFINSLLQPIRLRSLPPQRESSQSGSVVPSLLLYLLSKPCGSTSRSTTSLAHLSSTGNASEVQILFTINNFDKHKSRIFEYS